MKQWEDFKANCYRMGLSASAALNQFIQGFNQGEMCIDPGPVVNISLGLAKRVDDQTKGDFLLDELKRDVEDAEAELRREGKVQRWRQVKIRQSATKIRKIPTRILDTIHQIVAAETRG